MRADAARNRERLLEAAAELFATRGLGVTLDEVAAHAGVGVGTAYRRFPDKAALVDVLFQQRLDALADLATQCLQDPDPWDGLASFLEQSLALQVGDRGLAQILAGAVLPGDRLAEARDRVAPLVEALAARARDAGVVRPDFDQSDVVLLQVALGAVVEKTRTVAPSVHRRYLALLLDGIRPAGAPRAPLPVAALTPAQTHAAMTGGLTSAGDRPVRP